VVAPRKTGRRLTIPSLERRLASYSTGNNMLPLAADTVSNRHSTTGYGV
jgi:hypothetical protein